MALTIPQLIVRRCKGRAICEVFDEAPWSERSAALTQVGISHPDACTAHEISRHGAQQALAASLSIDLCYRTRRLGPTASAELAEAFLGLFPSSSRFYSNSAAPFRSAEPAWAFCSGTESTVDTGVIVRQGRTLAGVLWLADTD